MAKPFRTMLALPGPADEKIDRQFITALARGLEVLRVFEPGENFLGNQEIAERANLPKPTITRITRTLTMLGYLEYNGRLEKYSLGTPVLSLGYACLANLGVTRAARRHMQELADFAGASVTVASQDRLDMTYIEIVHGGSGGHLRLDVGARFPIWRTAMGMAYLHALPQDEREFMIEQIEKQIPEESADFRDRLDDAFQQLDTKGYYSTSGIFERGLNGAATAIVLPDSGTIYSITILGPAYQLPHDRIDEEIGYRLVSTARNIESELHNRPLAI
ncbi:helix-turn-helix domain-containing protein [Sneathiella chungangensis]|uniref:Helix-turn-helix domain-containing protein n=1 Tax=Sneathiella chungangensis TaxID=1418234 RepID=A0A845MIJ0_9PROT|nr:IclR family transcriptional regulator [Sneathiella chungangensis]MZR22804.1 helix-turn-helix domain-containing protein [Sneathiella chungangensis]